ncbi:MAG TPA: alpha/beta fold hydrolase, partial [Blastocatellia bacterium]|nr:alpha/beta fold hydrolase [Blastocatellia bacterium]
FSEIAKVFQQQLPLATLFQFPTVAQLAEVLRQRGWQASWRSLVALRPTGSRPPFFCVHAVGGNVLEYNDLAQLFPPDQPFYALQSIGLDGRTPAHTSIEAMAAAYLQELRQIQPRGPYFLGGRSFGGTVAFEMAQQLKANGEDVALLAMLDTYPLGWLSLYPPAEAARMEAEYKRQRWQRHWSNLRQLNLADKVEYCRNKAQYKSRKYKYTLWQFSQWLRRDASASLTDTLRQTEESNYRAAKRYRPQVYPGQLTFFCADEEVGVEESCKGWESLVAGGVEVIRVPGDHQTMIRAPHVQQLAKRLNECLQQASQTMMPERRQG